MDVCRIVGVDPLIDPKPHKLRFFGPMRASAPTAKRTFFTASSHLSYSLTCIGMTGLWQVSGRSKITDFDQVVALDRYYIENWTIWMDIHILLKTLLLPFRRDSGAF